MQIIKIQTGMSDKEALAYVEKVYGNVENKSFAYNKTSGKAAYRLLNPKDKPAPAEAKETEKETPPKRGR